MLTGSPRQQKNNQVHYILGQHLLAQRYIIFYFCSTKYKDDNKWCLLYSYRIMVFFIERKSYEFGLKYIISTYMIWIFT